MKPENFLLQVRALGEDVGGRGEGGGRKKEKYWHKMKD